MKSSYYSQHRGQGYYKKPPKKGSAKKPLLTGLVLGVLVGSLVLWNLSSAPVLRPYSVESAFLADTPAGSQGRYDLAPNTPQPAKSVRPPANPSAIPIERPTTTVASQTLPPVPTYAAAPPNLLPGVPIDPIATVGAGSQAADDTKEYPILFEKPAYNQPVGPVTVKNGQLVDGIGARFFLAGVNYEGHTDRAWVMWNNDRFDPALIQQNFASASAGGYNTVRVFVQTQLRDDILAGDFFKLDKLVDIGRSNNVFILLTMADYDEQDLRKLAKVNALVGEHYVNNPYMLGYDLKNEPGFFHIAGATYPDSVIPPFQTDTLIKAYGERINQNAADAFRRTSEGSRVIGGNLDSRTAYYLANSYYLYEDYLNDATTWAVKNGATSLDYMGTPEAQGKWKVFLDAASGTLQSWYDVLQGPIRQFDKVKPITTGFNNGFFARLPANNNMSFISFHRYTPVGADGLKATFSILESLKKALPGRPVCLEEFGYSNADATGRTITPSTVASHEAAIWLYLYGKGYAGGYKWMLKNFSIGANIYENNFGLFDDSNQPKASFYGSRAVLRMANANRAASGDFSALENTGKDGNVNYFWTSGNGFFGNSANFSNSRVKIEQKDSLPWAVWWPSNGLGQVQVAAGSAARITIDLRSVFPNWNAKQAPVIQVEDGQTPAVDRLQTGQISFNASPGTVYTINLPVPPVTFAKAQPLGGPNTIYFKETGHNLSNAFRNFWQQRNGQLLLGLPISEEFQEGGLSVQYFERARLEFHPEYSGTSAEVQLGLLGRLVTAGRSATEAPFRPTPAFQTTTDRIFFKETGHSLSTGFKAYWEKYGGLAQFGFPISEEFQELNPIDGKTYTMQYFERGRLEYHAEAKGTPFEIQAGLLGLQVLKARGWIQ